MVGHTGFLVTARRLAPGVTPPLRRKRLKAQALDSEALADEPAS
jgi:tRNA (adenine57-N1/adenine58-N1)-methyltransferase